MSKATGVVPAVNQIERHPVLQSNDLIAYCKEKNVHITAYSVWPFRPAYDPCLIIQAFGNNMIGLPLLVTRPEVKEVAEEASKRTGATVTPAQVILNWSQVGSHSVIPKSVTPHRILENFQEVDLTPEEIAKVTAVGNPQRRFNIPYVANKPRWDIDVFGEDEEKVASRKVNLGA